MECINQYSHPEYTPEERAEQFNALLRPAIDELLKHPDKYGRNAIVFIKTDDNGIKYYEDFDGNKVDM